MKSNFLPRAILFISFTILFLGVVKAQEKVNIYNPDADAASDIKTAMSQASATGKHVFLQVGGNWCPWCIRFHKFIHEDRELDSIVNANYVVVKLNYSKEKPNNQVLSELGYPQRFGFPVFVILDGNGKLLHIQDSGLLEAGKGYDRDKVKNMYLMWSAESIRLASEKYKP